MFWTAALWHRVRQVTIPGAEGDMTLGNHHSQVVSMLKPGVITVREGGNKEVPLGHYLKARRTQRTKE